VRAKLILVLTYDPEGRGMSPQALDRLGRHFKERTEEWARDPDEPVLGLLIPRGIQFKGYAVPEEALVELPEVLVRFEPEQPAAREV
jgi:hypothetical protein